MSNDPVERPSHYTAGHFEAIDVLEDSVAHAPCPVAASLQWQVMKYLLRMWLKGNPVQDAKKAQWYIGRLIERLDIE